MPRKKNRLIISEEHGIRRFLYPLSVHIRDSDVTDPPPGLVDASSHPVPSQFTLLDSTNRLGRLDFAVSMGPLEKQTLEIGRHDEQLTDDPLVIPEGRVLQSRQKRFRLSLDRYGNLDRVLYDQVPHLTGPCLTRLNGEIADCETHSASPPGARLAAWQFSDLVYPDGRQAETRTEITACKSWANILHTIDRPRPDDEIVFVLPVSCESPRQTYDFGIGGGIYGFLSRESTDTGIWTTEQKNRGLEWRVSGSDRLDALGTVSRDSFTTQRWFHLVDGDKALAVAITHLPADWRRLTVTIRGGGDTEVACLLGPLSEGPATVGVCYHFLNDVPAVAAATSPQSILQPPRVELEPA